MYMGRRYIGSYSIYDAHTDEYSPRKYFYSIEELAENVSFNVPFLCEEGCSDWVYVYLTGLPREIRITAIKKNPFEVIIYYKGLVHIATPTSPEVSYIRLLEDVEDFVFRTVSNLRDRYISKKDKELLESEG